MKEEKKYSHIRHDTWHPYFISRTTITFVIQCKGSEFVSEYKEVRVKDDLVWRMLRQVGAFSGIYSKYRYMTDEEAAKFRDVEGNLLPEVFVEPPSLWSRIKKWFEKEKK